MRKVNIEAGWKDRLANEFAADYMGALSQFLRAEKPLENTYIQLATKSLSLLT